MKYINVVEVKVNPTCPRSVSFGMFMHKTLIKLDSKFIQPGFKYNQSIMRDASYYAPSLLKLQFVNGYTREYNLSVSTFPAIKTELDWINNLVEFERSMGGQDDELEDE